jgi:hypothetical protein
VRRLLVVLFIMASHGIATATSSSVFTANCAPCHQVSGQGVAGAYPPLKDTVGSYVRVPQGRAYLAHVVAFGMTGAVVSQSQTYSGFMQPWSQLTDAEVTDVLNHILLDLNAALLPDTFAPFTSDEVHTLRAQRLTFEQVRSEREALMKALSAKTAAEPTHP